MWSHGAWLMRVSEAGQGGKKDRGGEEGGQGQWRPSPHGQNGRSPRVRRVTFVPYTRRIYVGWVRMTSGFESLCPLAHPPPRMRFVFLGPGLCLQLPSDSASRRTPLLFGSGFLSPRPPEGLPPSTSLPGSLSLPGCQRQAWRTKKAAQATAMPVPPEVWP